MKPLKNRISIFDGIGEVYDLDVIMTSIDNSIHFSFTLFAAISVVVWLIQLTWIIMDATQNYFKVGEVKVYRSYEIKLYAQHENKDDPSEPLNLILMISYPINIEMKTFCP